MRRPWRCRIAAIMRTVEDLPFVPTTWIAPKALLRRAQHGHQPAHAVQAEPHAEQLERRAGSARRRSSVQRLARSQRPSSSACSRSSLSRSACTTAGGRLGHEALVGQLALGARDLGLELGARRSARRARPPRGRRVGGQRPARCRRGWHRGDGSRRRSTERRGAPGARRAGRGVVAAASSRAEDTPGPARRTVSRQPRSAVTAPMTRSTSGLGLGVEQAASVVGKRAPASRPAAPGR